MHIVIRNTQIVIKYSLGRKNVRDKFVETEQTARASIFHGLKIFIAFDRIPTTQEVSFVRSSFTFCEFCKTNIFTLIQSIFQTFCHLKGFYVCVEGLKKAFWISSLESPKFENEGEWEVLERVCEQLIDKSKSTSLPPSPLFVSTIQSCPRNTTHKVQFLIHPSLVLLLNTFFVI